jgi:uncharacterized protein (UPF0264 family)
MQLLVSVSNPQEAAIAIAGGADVIDAKDPATGALGAVSLSTLRQIHAVVAGRRLVTAALGDAADEAAIERAACDYAAEGIGLVKVGFGGTTDLSRVERLLTAAIRGAQATGLPQCCGVIAVAYADTGGSSSVDRTALVDVAARVGASGVLLDTAIKSGPGLCHLIAPCILTRWVAAAHAAGLIVAMAGKVTLDDLAVIRDTGADIVGVRGAACEAGRASRVVEARVRALSQRHAV